MKSRYARYEAKKKQPESDIIDCTFFYTASRINGQRRKSQRHQCFQQ